MRIGKSGPYIQIAPKNYSGADNAGTNANRAIDHTVARANAQYLEALGTDGVPFLHWRKALEGWRCTCQLSVPSEEAVIEDAEEAALNGEDFSQDTTPHGDPTQSGYFKVRGKDRSPYNYSRGRDEYVDGGSGAQTTPGNEDTVEVSEFRTDIMRQFEQDGGLVLTPDDDLLLTADDAIPCGICFSTGRTDGYVLSNGKRIVLEASGIYPFNMQGFDLDTSKHPYAFTGNSNPQSYVEWSVELPSHFIRVLNIAVRNNMEPATSFKLEFCREGENSWNAFDVEYLNSRRGLAISGRLRAIPISVNPELSLSITHIEIHLQMHEWQRLQIEPLQESSNSAAFMATYSVSMTLPPTLVHVGKDDVIYEHKYNKLWKLSEITDGKTANGYVFNWTVSGRYLAPHESLNALLIVNDPLFSLSYRKLESGNPRSTEERDVFAYVNAQDDIKKKVASTLSGTHLKLAGEYVFVDMTKELDDLQMAMMISELKALPNVSTVWLSPEWYMNTTNPAGQPIRPKVKSTSTTDTSNPWNVSGIERSIATALTNPNHSGTISDNSLIRIINALKAAGYKVGLRPIIQVEAANAQRNQITFTGSPTTTDIDTFVGDLSLADFDVVSDEILCLDPSQYYTYEHFIYHYFYIARMCNVNSFLIGSQLKGLTHQKITAIANNGFYFAAALELIAEECQLSQSIGHTVEISYESDVSEAGAWISGLQVEYPLDGLWNQCDFIAINYNVRLTDWRNAGTNLDGAIGENIYSTPYLCYCFGHGIDYDFIYSSPSNANSQTRTLITTNNDQPWLNKPKAITALFTGEHKRFDGAGVEIGLTAFNADKKVVFTSVMCPSLTNATNDMQKIYEPNVAYTPAPFSLDTKSDDRLVSAYYYAFLLYWNMPANNPTFNNAYLYNFEYAGMGQFAFSDKVALETSLNGYIINGKVI